MTPLTIIKPHCRLIKHQPYLYGKPASTLLSSTSLATTLRLRSVTRWQRLSDQVNKERDKHVAYPSVF